MVLRKNKTLCMVEVVVVYHLGDGYVGLARTSVAWMPGI